MKTLRQYIEESLNANKNIQSINEDVYEGCEELAKFIVEKINENINKEFFSLDKSELKFPNIFFETLYVFINPEDNEAPVNKSKEFKKVRGRKILESVGAAYEILDTNKKNLIANTIKWNNETKTLNYLILKIYIYDDEFGTAVDYKMLVHELNHAYEDFNIRFDSDGRKTLNDYIYGYYNKARQTTRSSTPAKRSVGYIEYLNTGIETRSFCKQALAQFKENVHKYVNLDDAIEKQASDNDVFIDFFKWKNRFDYDKQFKSTRKDIIDGYKEIHEQDKDYLKESDDKILKRIESHWQKFYNALIKEIKKYYKKHYEKN